MFAIDEIQRAVWRAEALSRNPLPLEQLDPVVFISPRGDVWTLGMVQSMWQYLIDRSQAEIFTRRKATKTEHILF